MDTLQKIRELMDQHGWTEYKLAKEAELPLSTVTNMFRRQTAPTLPTLDVICQAFGLSLSQFFAQDGRWVELTEEQYQMFQQWAMLSKSQKELIDELISNMK